MPHQQQNASTNILPSEGQGQFGLENSIQLALAASLIDNSVNYLLHNIIYLVHSNQQNRSRRSIATAIWVCLFLCYRLSSKSDMVLCILYPFFLLWCFVLSQCGDVDRHWWGEPNNHDCLCRRWKWNWTYFVEKGY